MSCRSFGTPKRRHQPDWPAAEWSKCAERYEQSIPFYHFRHLVKPGITGWAQVNYPYGESDEDAVEKLKYDLYYIRHYSLSWMP
jgi:Sugar transferases involved in lipopolysaccharide synthesis